MLLTAFVGAVLGAAMAATASAPAARADDPLTDLVNAVDGDFALAQDAFTLANTDFGASDVAGGLAAVFAGVDDDVLSVPDNLLQGSIAGLTGVPVESSIDWSFPVTEFGPAALAASTIVLVGEGDFTTAASDLASGGLADALSVGLQGVDYLDVLAPEILLVGGLDSLGL
jgi:hypothetical protein